MQFLVDLLRQGGPALPLLPPRLPDDLRAGQEGQALRALPPEAILALKWALFSRAALAIMLLLAWAVSRRWASREREDIEEIHESLGGREGFQADLRWLLRLLQSWSQRRKEPVPASTVPAWYGKEAIPGLLGIREIYRHLLWEASGSGLARRHHETPYEYARRLGQAVPESTEPLGELTDSYISVRYGDLEAQTPKVERANALWRSLRPRLRRPGGGPRGKSR